MVERRFLSSEGDFFRDLIGAHLLLLHHRLPFRLTLQNLRSLLSLIIRPISGENGGYTLTVTLLCGDVVTLWLQIL